MIYHEDITQFSGIIGDVSYDFIWKPSLPTVLEEIELKLTALPELDALLVMCS